MVSIILTAWREANTVGKAVSQLLSQVDDIEDDVELLLVCPDEETYKAARTVVEKSGFPNFVYIKDLQKGKPHALNLAFEKAKGDIILSTDGDVYIDEGALKALLEPFSQKGVMAVTGRPVCSNDKKTRWGYWGHMFMDAAHKKRIETLAQGKFFHMSGYLLAMKGAKPKVPDGVLDDVYFSYKIHELNGNIAYAPGARVFVRQPENIGDWVKQKVRSIAGQANLDEYISKVPVVRTFSDELTYVLFPIRYASNVRELVWSLMVYPFRLYVWALAFWSVRVSRKKASELWERIESTKR